VTEKSNGIPVGLAIDAANVPETALGAAALAMIAVMFTAMDTAVLADKAYDSDWLREHLAACGFILVAPHKSNRTSPAMIDGRRLRRYPRRFQVERTFAWLHSYRRVVTRFEKRMAHFEGFVQLACAFISISNLI
jgi:transposase